MGAEHAYYRLCDRPCPVLQIAAHRLTATCRLKPSLKPRASFQRVLDSRLWRLANFEDSLDFDGKIEGQGRHADRKPGVTAGFAEDFDEKLGSPV